MIYHQKLAKNDSFREVFSFSAIPHLHNEIEIVFVKDGDTVLTIDKQEYEVKPNSLSIVFPNQVHKYSDNLNTVTGYMLHLPMDYLKIGCMLPKNPQITNLSQTALDVLSNLQNCDIDSEILLKELLAEISLKLNLTKNNCSELSTTQMILKYCFENYKEALTLDQLSKELSINKFYISHIFNSKLKIGFTDYLSLLRVEEAKKLLCSTDISITNIAYDVGFSTIRSFNRRFREFCGMAPKDYKEKYKNESTN